MPHEIDEGANWILGAAGELNRHGSWTGRIHIHKLLFITQILRLAKPPFKFEVYEYGPYSFGLDEEINRLEMFGFLDRSYPKPGYGPRYEPTLKGREAAGKLPKEAASAIGRVAAQLGERNSQALELLATCLWAERKEKVTEDQKILARVRELKPKYSEGEVRGGLEDARGIAASLAK
jgi:uncharacterized protein YwgA